VLHALDNCPHLLVKVKPHPMMPQSELMRHCGIDAVPGHFQFVEGGLDEWLDRARFIISAGSAVLYEAVAAGVPAIAVGREGGLNLNPLAWLTPQYERGTSTKNIPGTSYGHGHLNSAGLRGFKADVAARAVPEHGGDYEACSTDTVSALDAPCVTCYAPDDIRLAAERLWNLSAADRRHRELDAEAFRRTSFNPTNDDTLRAFVEDLIETPTSSSQVAITNCKLRIRN
jgi:hypothetical protein